MESVPLTTAQYNYLLPVYGLAAGSGKLLFCCNKHYFVGTPSEIVDMRRRLVGLSW